MTSRSEVVLFSAVTIRVLWLSVSSDTGAVLLCAASIRFNSLSHARAGVKVEIAQTLTLCVHRFPQWVLEGKGFGVSAKTDS